MVTFRDKRTGTVKTGYSIRRQDDNVFIKFTEHGKEYCYQEKNIECLDMERNIVIYTLKQPCYRCGKITDVLTYLLFDDGKNDNLIFPWDKNRLNHKKSWEQTLMHMEHEDIEFYPIKVIGSDQQLDLWMLKQFPDKILMEYSATQKRTYPMNICQHCGAKQGEFFIYKRINEKIRAMEQLEVYKTSM